MGRGTANGKLILFGEHFVVYGSPAIVIPVDRTIKIELKKSENIPDDNPEHISKMISIIKSELKIKEHFRIISIESDLPMSSGFGSSAALSVALIRAVLDELSISLEEKKIFDIAIKLENLFHSNSSGVDVYVALTNNPIIYRRAENRIDIQKIQINIDAKLGVKIIPREYTTGEIVNMVRRYSKDYPKIFDRLREAYEELVKTAVEDLASTNLNRVAELMNINQSLLRAIGVSDNRVDSIISDMLRMGIIGAKISGAGKGGAIIGIYQNSDYKFDIQMELRSVK